MPKQKKMWDNILTVIMTLLSLLWIYPIVLILLNSLKIEGSFTTSTVFKLPTAETFAGLSNYVYGVTKMGFLSSLGYSLVITVTSVALILLCCLFLPREGLTVPRQETLPDKRRTAVYGVLFCVAVAMVLRGIPYWLGLLVIVMALLVLDRRALLGVDWGLLATFAAFFTFSGNLARMESVRALFARLLSHGTMLISALTCQIISNVPAAILLSRFTQDARALLVGVNVGGAGTLVASLASLITFREYTRRVPNGGKSFLLLFSGISFAFLAILLTVMSIPM